MTKKEKKRGRVKYKNLKMLSTKGVFFIFYFFGEKFYFDGKNKNVDTSFNCLNKLS